MTTTDLQTIHERLEIPPNTILSRGHKPRTGGNFRGSVITASQAHNLVSRMNGDGDHWLGLNGLRPGITQGRGKATDVVSVYALVADLDVKEGGMPSYDVADAVIATLSDILGSTPVAIISSGHGRQPIWATDEPDNISEWGELLAPFNRLVQQIGSQHGGQVDTTKDLARVWRVPGSTNYKNPAEPVPVTATFPNNYHPITLTDLQEALDCYLTETPTNPSQTSHQPTHVLPTAPLDTNPWHYLPDGHNCHYVTAMINAWDTDIPTNGRHPWLISQATRLAAAHRLGCLTDTQHTEAIQSLTRRFKELVKDREIPPSEVPDAFLYANTLVSSKSETDCRQELGNHTHNNNTPPPNTPTATATPANIPGEYETEPLARRIAPDALQAGFLWVHGIGWHEWDTRRWATGEAVDTHVQTWVADRVETEIHDAIDRKEDLTVIKRLTRYRDNTNHLTDKMRLNPTICAVPSTLDNNPDLLNCQNGTIDLTTGELHPHKKTDYITKLTPLNYHPDAKSDNWTSALQAFSSDNVANYLQVKFGQAAYGEISPDDRLTIFHGGGANGKSTILEGVSTALGEYSKLIPDSLLMGTDHRERANEMLVLLGLRVGFMEELPDGKRLDTAKLKKLLGTESVVARRLYSKQGHFNFTPTHGLLMATNYLPQVSDNDYGVWRRLELIEFPYKFVSNPDPDNPRERQGNQKLRHAVLHDTPTREAILAWVVRGAVEYHQTHHRSIPPQPTEIVDAVTRWRESANPIAAYASEHLEESHRDHLHSAGLYDHYSRWADLNGYKPMSAQTFREKLLGVFPSVEFEHTKRHPTSGPPGWELVEPTPGKKWRAIFGLRFKDQTHEE